MDQAPPGIYHHGAWAISADGTLLAYPASSERGTEIRLWDIATGKVMGGVVRVVGGDIITFLTISPDGKLLAAGFEGGPTNLGDHRIVLWELATKKQTAVLRMNRVPRILAFSPDGQTLASSAREPYVRLWEVKTGKERANLLDGEAHRLTFSPNGKQLFGSGGYWNLDAERWEGLSSRSDLTISPDSKQFAYSVGQDGNGGIEVVDTETMKVNRTLKSAGRVLAFSHNGKVLAVGKKDGVDLVAVETDKTITLEGAKGVRLDFSRDLTFSRDGKSLIAVVRVLPEKKGEPERCVVKVWELAWEKDAGK